jgi:DNA-binding MarR family transcriptional regulator
VGEIQQTAGPASGRDPSGGGEWSDTVERIIADWHAELPEVDTSPIRIIARVARLETMIAPYLRASFARDKLTVGLFDVLAALRRSGRPYRRTPTELAKLTMLTTGGITGRVDRLEEAGLIEREPSDSDRRITYVKLTPRGLEVVDHALRSLLETERRLLEGLTKAQMKRLADDLADLERSVFEAAQRAVDVSAA